MGTALAKIDTAKLPLRLALFLNKRCNLSCDYCYLAFAPDDKEKEIELSLAREIAAKALKDPAPEINFGFFGAEPMLSFRKIREITDIMEERANGSGKKITFSLNTNATCITEDAAQFFREKEFFITVGMDGVGPAQNKHRRLLDEGCEYRSAEEGLQTLLSYGVAPHVRITYTPETVLTLSDALISLAMFGVLSVGVAGAYAYGNWNNIAFDKLKTAFNELTEAWLVLRAKGYDITVTEIETCLKLGLTSPPLGSKRPSCTELKNLFAIDLNGDVYACYRIVGERGEKKVSIFEVKDFAEVRAALDNAFTVRPPQCETCSVANLCRFCPVLYEKAGEEIYCKARRIAFSAILETLQKYEE
ncbi:MAG: hypothetical protein Kow0090_00560 [Myxococcota bacterium]